MIDERLSDEKFDEVIQMNDPTSMKICLKLLILFQIFWFNIKMILLKFGMNFRLQHCMLSIDFLGSCNLVNQPKPTPNIIGNLADRRAENYFEMNKRIFLMNKKFKSII